ncbi:hypothetical protein, partial [Cupriavidus campinensis]|uniref:hypothetical protein n=1 Tax=Cupriavidus campinensis TaxID=151783 RepID=UPI0036063067
YEQGAPEGPPVRAFATESAAQSYLASEAAKRARPDDAWHRRNPEHEFTILEIELDEADE